jgi:hypothetical protein
MNKSVRKVSKIICEAGASYDELNASPCPHPNFHAIRNLLIHANSYHCFPMMPIPFRGARRTPLVHLSRVGLLARQKCFSTMLT